ncbi:MAG: efflux RND transporter periplasmic adaptor subunit [Chloroflexota bacterium]|nr:MAG: efflux RND transporter periplasmic adaptor subunit [Chloroflexota bacterium]
MRTIITILIVIAVIVGAYLIYTAYQNQQEQAALSSLQTVSATRGNLTATVGATGVVRANQSATLVWQTNGIVDRVAVSPGERVEDDQVLADLAQTSLPQNVILARADLVEAQNALDNLRQSGLSREQALQALHDAQRAVIEAERALDPFEDDAYADKLDQAREDVVDAQEALQNAQEDFEPYQDWAEDNQTRKNFEDRLNDAQRDYDEAVRALDMLEIDSDVAVSNLSIANAQLADAQREYDRLKDGPDPDEVASLEARISAAQATLDMASLKAPFAGTVTEITVKPGDQVAPGAVAFRLDDLSRLLVDVQISEVDINRIARGQSVSLTFDAIQDQEYHGVVTEVAQVGNPVEGVVEFVVTVELNDADEKVKPGMTGAVNIVVEQLENVLLVPNRAVRVAEGERVVYVLREDAMEQVPITLGSSSDTMSEVVDGSLQSGDAIILNPPQFFGNDGPPFFRR